MLFLLNTIITRNQKSRLLNTFRQSLTTKQAFQNGRRWSVNDIQDGNVLPTKFSVTIGGQEAQEIFTNPCIFYQSTRRPLTVTLCRSLN